MVINLVLGATKELFGTAVTLKMLRSVYSKSAEISVEGLDGSRDDCLIDCLDVEVDRIDN